ncbi:MAG: cyclic nucleotide-binding domain-containing protein [Candidatus Latescibacterota bacterium]
MNGAEKRKAEQKARLLALIEKVPVFADLTDSERTKVLARCAKVTLESGDILCTQGDESSAMFILLLGKLAVRISRSAAIATLVPVTSIGEMGVFTGEPRSATVEAMEKSALLRLDVADINTLIEQNPSLGVRIMRRVIHILAERVSTDNTRIREFQNYLIERGE